MKNKIIIPSTLFVVIASFSIITLQNNNRSKQAGNYLPNGIEPLKQSIVLFYGEDCPHCEIVEKYIAENTIELNEFLAKKEVYYNKQNANELVEKAKICGISTDAIGVPFMWDGSKCFVGDQEIIEFLKIKNNQQ